MACDDEYTWVRITYGLLIAIVPEDDLVIHDSAVACVCGPEVYERHVPGEAVRLVYVHHALDDRPAAPWRHMLDLGDEEGG